jgi:hypothetical protein
MCPEEVNPIGPKVFAEQIVHFIPLRSRPHFSGGWSLQEIERTVAPRFIASAPESCSMFSLGDFSRFTAELPCTL